MNTVLLAYFLHHFGITSLENNPNVPSTIGLEVHQTVSEVRSFPKGSQRIPLLHLEFTASCDKNIPILSLRLRHRGLGAINDIDSVYLYSASRRLNRGRQIQRNGTVEINLRNIEVPACKTIEMTVMADFSDNAAISGEHWFELESPAGRVVQSKSVRRPKVSGGTAVGKITVEYPKLLRRVRYGEKQAIARILLTADNKSHHKIQAITVTNNGSASDTDLTNLYLETGAKKQVTLVQSSLDKDRVRLVFDPPLIVRKNQKRLFTLRADVHVGRSKTLQMFIEEASDIEATSVRRR